MKNYKMFVLLSGRNFLIVSVAFLLLISLGCQSKTSVRKLTTSQNPNKKTETNVINGSMYHLPLTIVKASVPMKLSQQKPGEFSDFTPCYFSPEEAEKRYTSEKKAFTIETPAFDFYGKADLAETFVVQTTGNYFESRTVSATVNKEGNLSEGSAESKDEAIPFAIKTAEIVAGLGIKALTFGGGIPLSNKSNIKDEFGNELPPLPAEDKVNELLEKESNCYLIGFQYHINKIINKIEELKVELAILQKEPEKNQEKIDQTNKSREKLQAERDDWVKNRQESAARKMKILKAEMESWKKTVSQNAPATPANTDPGKTKNSSKKKNGKNVAETDGNDELMRALSVYNNTISNPFRSTFPLYITFVNAQKAYEDLKDFQTERDNIANNVANIDPKVYESRLKELDDKIKPLTESFFGKKESFEWTGNFEFTPTKDTDKEVKTLFVYSKANGICYNDNFKTELQNDGILVAKEFQFNKCNSNLPEQELLKLQLFARREPNDTVFIQSVNDAKERAPKNLSSGWYFRIPANATIALFECKSDIIPCKENIKDSEKNRKDDVTEYKRQQTKIAQYGAVVSLPAKTAGRSSSTSISLDETTGALKNFKASSSPLIDKSTIEGIGKTAEKLVDSSDALAKKKRELDLLKTQNEINEQRKKLDGTPTPTPEP